MFVKITTDINNTLLINTNSIVFIEISNDIFLIHLSGYPDNPVRAVQIEPQEFMDFFKKEPITVIEEIQVTKEEFSNQIPSFEDFKKEKKAAW